MKISGKTIAILMVPEFRMNRPLGGAEAIAEKVIIALSIKFSVLVFHGYSHPSTKEKIFRRHMHNVISYPSFQITEDIQHHGVIPIESFDAHARNLLLSSLAIIQFERILNIENIIPRILVLGGTCYNHSHECMKLSKYWNKLIVPSSYVKKFAASVFDAPVEKIDIIYNGIDCDNFSPKKTKDIGNDCIQILIPARPDCGKGFYEAIEFARTCQSMGIKTTVTYFEQRSFIALDSFYSDIDKTTCDITKKVIPWIPRKHMVDYYQQSDLTLCLGTLPEGFGLAACESLACGTPVIARKIGFLEKLVPNGYGMMWVDNEQPEIIVRNYLSNREVIANNCYKRGIAYVNAHYNETQMIEKYMNVISEVTEEKYFNE